MAAIKEFIKRTPLAPPLRRMWRAYKRACDGNGSSSAQCVTAPARVDLQELRRQHTFHALRELEDFLFSRERISFRSEHEPVISVVMPLFNRAELTLAALRSLACSSVPLQIILIDNCSSDQTELLFSRIDGVTYVRNQHNVHFLMATNQGARLARGRHILMLNSDTEVVPGALEAALRRLEGDARIGAVGARLILPDGSLQEAGCFVWQDGTCQGYGRGDSPVRTEYLFPRPVDFCSGAFLLTPRAVWEELGGLDEAFKPAYYEEVDYCMRVWGSGRSVWYEPRAAVRHFEFASAQTSAAPVALMLEHQRIFAERHVQVLGTRPLPGGAAPVTMRTPAAARRPAVLVCDERLPHVKTGAGYPRANRMVAALTELGCEVTVLPMMHVDAGEDALSLYSDIPSQVEVVGVPQRQAGVAALEQLLRERAGMYRHLIVSRPTTMGEVQPLRARAPELFEGINLIYDAEAIFALREARERELAGKPLSPAEQTAAVARELQLCHGFRTVLTVSHEEAGHFRQHGYTPTVVGHAVEGRRSLAPWHTRRDVLFVGAIYGDGGPNYQAVQWFLANVWPQLRQRLPESCFVIAGVNHSPTLTQQALPERVVVTGALDDLGAVFDQARVFVAPTLAAAGIPLKVVEAAGWGVPVVCTELLRQQLRWSAPDEVRVAATGAEFSEACYKLFTDQGAWEAQRSAALARVESEYSMSAFRNQIRQALAGG